MYSNLVWVNTFIDLSLSSHECTLLMFDFFWYSTGSIENYHKDRLMRQGVEVNKEPVCQIDDLDSSRHVGRHPPCCHDFNKIVNVKLIVS